MNSISRTALVFGVGLLALPGCPLLDLQVDAQEVCLHYPNLQIPGVTGGEHSLKQSFVFDDLSAVHELTDKVDANLEFVRAEVVAASVIESFDFIDEVHITVASGDPGSGLPVLKMYDCTDCAKDGDSLEIPAAVGGDAIAYLRGDSIKINLDFVGQVPTVAWAIDVNVCMKARVGYTFSP